MEIRQSLKGVKAAYLACALLELALAVFWYAAQPGVTFWAVGPLPAVFAVFVAIRHIQRRMTRLSISQDRMHFERGFLSKSTETVDLSKVQDVRVNQTMGQRILNIGTISFETAGGSSRIAMESIDRPQEVANHILDMARAAGRAQAQGGLS